MRQPHFTIYAFSMAVLALLAAQSCSLYQPHMTTVPLLKSKGEVMVEGSLAFPFNATPSMNLSVSAAPANHLAVQAYGSFTNDSNNYAQGAVGMFFPTVRNTVLELYAGFGYGSSNSNQNSSNSSRSSSYNDVCYGYYRIFFGQLNYGWRDLGKVDLGFGIKVGGLYPSFTQYDFNLQQHTNELTNPQLFVEPLFLFRVGGEYTKFTLQMGYTTLHFHDPFELSHFSISTGVQLRF